MFPAASSLTEIGTFHVVFPATVVIVCARTGRAKNSPSNNQHTLLVKRMLPPLFIRRSSGSVAKDSATANGVSLISISPQF